MNFKIFALFAFVLLASFSFVFPQETEFDCEEIGGTCEKKDECGEPFVDETIDCTLDGGKICCIPEIYIDKSIVTKIPIPNHN